MTEKIKQTRRRGYTRLSSKRQVTLPVRVVRELGIETGEPLRVEAHGGRVVLIREPGAGDRRRAIEKAAGSLTGTYPPGYLRKLRREWR